MLTSPQIHTIFPTTDTVMSGRQPPAAASGRFLHHSKNLKDAVGDELLDKMEKTGKVPSSEKFRCARRRIPPRSSCLTSLCLQTHDLFHDCVDWRLPVRRPLRVFARPSPRHRGFQGRCCTRPRVAFPVPALILLVVQMKPAKNAKSLSAVKDTFYWCVFRAPTCLFLRIPKDCH